LPEAFARLPSGEPYPSGTAYEVLSAIEARKAARDLPDVYVFRHPSAPSISLDAPDRVEIETQWQKLQGFFDSWFRNRGGEFLAAFQDYDSTDDFAKKVEACLRQWLARRGVLPQGAVWDRILRGSPFPGLAAFEADRGTVFFGRDLAIKQSLERLREAGAGEKRLPFLLVIGASGSGKSSLLRAALLPRLIAPGTIPEIDLWRTALVTPGPEPFLALAESLLAETALGPELRQGAFKTKEILAKQLAAAPDIALAPLREALDKAAARRQSEAGFEAPRPARLALAVDQAERLFSEAPPEQAAAFADLLAALARHKLAYLVLALRSDAYPRFQALPALVGLREAGATFDLTPPTSGELEEIVTRPVAACQPKLAFEQRDGRSLAALLVADATGGDALPLLQMTLSRLYAAEARRGDGVLRFADYRGMDAAVTKTANDALEKLDAESRAQLPDMVAGLVADVASDPATGALRPLVAPLDRAAFEAGNPARKKLIEAFVEHRLLTAEGDAWAQRVRPTHEAFLRIWPRAVEIVAETAALIRVRHTLEPMARQWAEADEAAKPGHLEISPALLAGGLQAVARFGADLPQTLRDFIAKAAAVDAEKRDRERREQERRIRDARTIARRTGIGLVAALLLVGLAGWQWRSAEAERVAAEQARQEATAQRDRAEKTLALATDTANGLVFGLAQEFRNVVGVPAATIKDILDRARQLQDQLLAGGENSPTLSQSQAAALEVTVDSLMTLGDSKGALDLATKAKEIRKALVDEHPEISHLQNDLWVAFGKVGNVQVAQGALPQALASYLASLAIAERLAKSDPGNADWQRDLSVSYEKVGDVQVAQGALPQALASYQASLAIRERVAKSDPGKAVWEHDLLVSYIKVGHGQVAQGALPQAMASYQAGLAIAERLAKSDPGNADWQRGLSVTYGSVGDVQFAQGALPQAMASYQAGLAIAERLAKSDPGNADWQRELPVSYNRVGDAQVAQGALPQALDSYQAGLAIAERLAKSDPSNADWQRELSVSYNKVGDVQAAQGALPQALASYQEGHTIAERLAKSDPGNADCQRDLSVSYGKVGNVQVAQGALPQALASYLASLAIDERLAKSDPGRADWQRDLSVSYSKVADVQVAQGALPQALDSHQAGLAIAEHLVKSDPGNASWQRDLSASYEKIGNIQVAQGALSQALASYEASLAIDERLATSDPGNADWQRNLSVVYENIGRVQWIQGALSQALVSYQAGIAISERLAKSDPSNADWQRDLSVFYENVGDVQVAQGSLPQALASYQACRDIRERLAQSYPGNGGWQNDLSMSYEKIGKVQRAQGALPQASVSYQSSLAIRERLAKSDPSNADWQRDLSVAYENVGDAQVAQGSLPQALDSYQASHTIAERLAKSDPSNADCQRDLSVSFAKLADTYDKSHQPRKALEALLAGRDIIARLVSQFPQRAQWKHDLAWFDRHIAALKK
jgi:tetratricopeptide (TPR) repeat protein